MNEETGAQKCDKPGFSTGPGPNLWDARMDEARQSPGQWFRIPFATKRVGSAKTRLLLKASNGERWEVAGRKDAESPAGGWMYYRLAETS